MTAARAKAQKAAPAPTPAAPQPASPAQPMRLPRPIIESGPAVRLGGDPLPESTRTPLEASFGADLSPVRVHSDSQSAAAAQNMDARAFAYGSHIFVGPNASAHDVPLMAHETAHVLQQSARPAVRLSSADNSPAFEVEANAASAAVMRGDTFTVQQQTGETHPQFDGGGGIIGRVMNAIASLVRNIPGYMLVSFIIGRDIVANRPVERNAVNLVGAIMGLVPGGNAMFENLQQSGALQRAFEWFSAEFARLNFTWDYIRGLFTRFTDSLGFSDIFNPGGVIRRLGEVFGEPVRRLREFAGNAVMKVLEFIFEGVMGAGGAQIIAIFRRARATFELIIRDPIRFIGNLIQALKGGFNAFKANIVTHLQAGLIGWLTGALGGAGITLPARFDARGILSLVLQILGLTYQNLRERLVRLIGEPRVRLLEGAFEFIRVIVTQGLAAAWQKIVEFAGNLTDMVIGGIRDFVVQTIVQQAIVRLISFFNPAGAIIQAILAIYNAVQWFIQRIQQIMQLVNAVVESIANIAAGNLSAAITYVEQSMARALPVIISFLAGLLGLNRIADQVKDVIRRIRAVINRALDRVFDFLATRIRSFAGRGGDQDPQLRLQRGLADGTAAVNRFAGRRVGALVLRPLLTAIRVRHRMQSLDVVQDGDNWAVEGSVNPIGRERTRAQAEGTAGTNPAPIADIRGVEIVLRVSVGTRTFNITHSLQRHHYLRLQTGGVERENSIMHASLPIETARRDMVELGRQIQTKLTRNTRGSVEGRYSVGERAYRIDSPTHSFVTNGQGVWGGVSDNEWLATRAVRQVETRTARSNIPLSARNIRLMLSARALQRLRQQGRLPEGVFVTRVPFVSTAVTQFRALSRASITRVIQVSNQEQIVNAFATLVELDN